MDFFNTNQPTTKKKSLKDKFFGLFQPTPISPTPDVIPQNFFGKVKDIVAPESDLISPIPKNKVPQAMTVEEAVQPKLTPTIPMPTPTPKQQQMTKNPAVMDYNITDMVKDAIFRATDEYNLPPTLLADIALQESSFQADKKSDKSTATGLLQFLEKTWNWLKEKKVIPEDADRNDPYANAMAAGWCIANGHLRFWNESKNVWGGYYDPEELKDYYKWGE